MQPPFSPPSRLKVTFPSLPPCPRCPADQQTSQPALSYRLSPFLFLSVTTSPSLFVSFRETPLLPCPALSVLCFSRLASRTVAPSLCLSGVLSTPPADRTWASRVQRPEEPTATAAASGQPATAGACGAAPLTDREWLGSVLRVSFSYVERGNEKSTTQQPAALK